MNIKINELLIGTNKTILPENVEVYKDLKECRSDDFIFGTESDCNRIIQLNNEHNGKNVSYFDLKITDFLPFLKEEYICPNGYFKQLWQLNKNDIGKLLIFNSKKDKCFKRTVLNNCDDIECLKHSTYEEEMVYITDKILYTDYNRYWVVNGKIITCCNYNDKQTCYANKIIEQYYEPAIKYTIDIVFDLKDNSFKVFDYNSFSTSEFVLDVDINKILESIK